MRVRLKTTGVIRRNAQKLRLRPQRMRLCLRLRCPPNMRVALLLGDVPSEVCAASETVPLRAGR